ncbi:helix-turn-helix domain-containing protein [Actinomadura rubrisoli]|uniref:helix-turn-helix domain-containing protein n=1 Tax=Actinomadura rubrisoli TaxID=2530368 RepID=UPI001A9FCCA0|nr:helix-turn-helix transcriptional regulator [Actinomadura rubrisoli]
MNRQTITYTWRLREVMAARGLHTISDLIPLLTARGVTLSTSQIYRQVGTRPDRISLTVLGALIDALECTVEDLCAFDVHGAVPPASGAGHPVVLAQPDRRAPGPPHRLAGPHAPASAADAGARETADEDFTQSA